MAKNSEKATTKRRAKNSLHSDGAGKLEDQDAQPRYVASIFPGPERPIPNEVGKLAEALELELGIPTWFLIQGGNSDYDFLGPQVSEAFVAAIHDLPKDKQVALIIDTLGGSARAAYRIATLLQRYCDGFVAVIPRYAKSAGTLLALGADKVILGMHGELGPLDAQIIDREREDIISALDEVHALERLQASSLEAVDKTMFLLTPRTGKKVDTLLPRALDFVATMMRPLFEGVDVVRYTQLSRMLKVAEEYAKRLLYHWCSYEDANRIARHLVEHYPEHEFVINKEEAAALGLPIEEPTDELDDILDLLYHNLDGLTIIGQVQVEEEG